MALKSISETALWTAAYRAEETERPDALFRDRWARRLAGQHGMQLIEAVPQAAENGWVIVIRTYLIDQCIREAVDQGVDMVVNLGAGLDTRPYRMVLPKSLQWIEVDLAGLLAYKERILQDAEPNCGLQRIALDLTDMASRRQMLEQLDRRTKSACILTEGLLIYLTEDQVSSIARDLALSLHFRRWTFDIQLPALMRLLDRMMGRTKNQPAPLKFHPTEWRRLFASLDWRAVDTKSMLQAAAEANRIPESWRPRGTYSAGWEMLSDSRRIDGLVCSVIRDRELD